MRVRSNLVLVALPPQPDATASGILLAPTAPPLLTSGRVVRVGPKCQDVQPRDFVAFPPEAGAHEWQIGSHRCLLIRESDICAVYDDAKEHVTA